jgi:hypothetical protein
MVIDVRPMRTQDARKRTTSPTCTGFLNSTLLMATVTNAALLGVSAVDLQVSGGSFG